jgi:hypothetical protein
MVAAEDHPSNAAFFHSGGHPKFRRDTLLFRALACAFATIINPPLAIENIGRRNIGVLGAGTMPKTPGKPPFSIVSDETTGICPPRKLGPHGAALWGRIQNEYGISDTGGAEILCQICQSLDRAEELAEAIARDGPVIYTRAGVPKSHPAIKDELSCRAFVTRAIERLGLNIEALKPGPGRPPGYWKPT